MSLGDGVRLGNNVSLGNGVRLGDGVTSEALNECFRQAYLSGSETHIFWKWVTPARKSPNFDGGTVLTYAQEAVVEAEAVVSDQQCAAGLHVLRPGYRPEWVGLCAPGHDLICLRVEVASADILFAGLPTMDAKVRVQRLKVLD